MYKTGREADVSWINSQTDEYKNAWGAGTVKGLHDPCPAGWRVANKDYYRPLLTGSISGGYSYTMLKTGLRLKMVVTWSTMIKKGKTRLTFIWQGIGI